MLRRSFLSQSTALTAFGTMAVAVAKPSWDPFKVDGSLVQDTEQILAHNLRLLLAGKGSLPDLAESQTLLHMLVRHVGNAGFAEVADAHMRQWTGSEEAAVHKAAEHLAQRHGIQLPDESVNAIGKVAATGLKMDYNTTVWTALATWRAAVGTMPLPKSNLQPAIFRSNKPHLVHVQASNAACYASQWSVVNDYYAKGYTAPGQGQAVLANCASNIAEYGAGQLKDYSAVISGTGGALSFFGFPEAGAPFAAIGGAIGVAGFILDGIGKLFDML